MEKTKFNKKKQAVDMYIDGFSIKEISGKTGIPHQKISGLVQRCITNNPETNYQFGYTALIPNKIICNNIPAVDDIDKVKGSFFQLLLKYPVLSTFIEDNYFRQNNTLEKNIKISNLHKKFIEECRHLQIQDYEYPFNTKDKARRTFYNYIRELEAKRFNKAMIRQDKNAQQKFFSTGIGTSIRPIPLAPYDVVQLDGHKIDMLYTVEVRNKFGEIELMPAMRMWLIAVIDVATRVIIGYSLTPNENYNQADVLRALRNAIIPKTPLDFTLNGLSYPHNYGYPSLAIEDTQWAIFDTIMLDNAKSHLAENVIIKLTSQLFCSLNYGSVATPETRGIVERVFQTLEENGYHRLPSTTGSNINDSRRVNAEKDAVKYRISYNDIAQLTEYFIAQYNNSPHSALDNQTPLQCMQRRIVEAGMKPFIADETMKAKIYSLINFTEIKTIRGSISSGKRPYITYKGVEYRNDILAQSMGLIGKKLIIEINPDNIRTITGYFSDGSELGILTAVGEWGRKNHSLKTREDAMKIANQNKQSNTPFYAPLTEFENQLNERAKTDRRARTKAARIRTEQNKELTTVSSTNPDNIIEIMSPQKNESKNNEIRRKRDAYTKEEWNAILNAGSLEEAFKKGLI